MKMYIYLTLLNKVVCVVLASIFSIEAVYARSRELGAIRQSLDGGLKMVGWGYFMGYGGGLELLSSRAHLQDGGGEGV